MGLCGLAVDALMALVCNEAFVPGKQLMDQLVIVFQQVVSAMPTELELCIYFIACLKRYKLSLQRLIIAR